jgi:serine/threonine protein kinase
MSPEQIDETKYNEKSDIWSLGCFLYELTTLKPPFQARNQIQLAMRIKEGKFEKINKRYSEELWRVIIWMLNTNYEKRPSAEELLSIPEVSVRIREKKIKENYNIIKILEDKLNLKEKELSEREEELNKRERRIIEMENKNNLKESELNEKEQKLIEFEKKLKMSSSTGYSSSKLKSSGNSEVNITLSPTSINGNCGDNNIDLKSNIYLPNSFNNELSNLLVYTNNNIKNQDLNNINDTLLFPNAHKLSKTNNIISSLESRMKKINSKYKNNNYLNEDAKFIHDENEYKKYQN